MSKPCKYCDRGMRVDEDGYHWVSVNLDKPTVNLAKCTAWQSEDTSMTYEKLGRGYDEL